MIQRILIAMSLKQTPVWWAVNSNVPCVTHIDKILDPCISCCAINIHILMSMPHCIHSIDLESISFNRYGVFFLFKKNIIQYALFLSQNLDHLPVLRRRTCTFWWSYGLGHMLELTRCGVAQSAMRDDGCYHCSEHDGRARPSLVLSHR